MTRSRLILLLLACLLLGGGGYIYFYAKSAENDKSGPVVQAVERQDITQEVIATGTLEAYRLVTVGAQVSGQLKSLAVTLGQTLKTGDTIAEIDSLPQQNNVRDAEAALNSLKAQLASRQAVLKQSELAFARQKRLLAADATAREAYESAQASLDTARAEVTVTESQITQAEANLNTAQLDLGYTHIVAPIDGVVVAIVTQEGQTVNANQSAPTIIKMAQLDTMTIKAQISEADVTRVKPGQRIYFTILGEPGRRYEATLRGVEPAPDSINDESTSSSSSSSTAIYYNGLFDVPNLEGQLRISMTAEVHIILAEAKNALVVPATALGTRDEDGRYAVRVQQPDGRFMTRQVKVGINNNVTAEILDGLAEGDKVVIADMAPIGTADTTSSSNRRMPPMRL